MEWYRLFGLKRSAFFLISGTRNKKAAHANSDTMDFLLRWIEIKRKFSKIDLLA